MVMNVNIHANSIIESSIALIKFMEVLMNVYLPYSLNCYVDVNEYIFCLNEQQKVYVQCCSVPPHKTNCKQNITRRD